MNELEEIKTRRSTRRKEQGTTLITDGHWAKERCVEAEADLDRVIAMLENEILVRRQARADVLKLRDLLIDTPNWRLTFVGSPYGGVETKEQKKLEQLLSETEYYEHYRQS